MSDPYGKSYGGPHPLPMSGYAVSQEIAELSNVTCPGRGFSQLVGYLVGDDR